MTSPIGSFSGLASGIQWRDMIDQIMQLEQQRRLDPLTTAKSTEQKRYDAWTSWQTLVSKFRDATKALRDATAFSQFQVTGGTSDTSGRTLLTATANTSASPGTFGVEVLDLARANKLSGSVQSSATTALGLTGEFAVNGKKVTISATDTLANVRDKINALNSGSTPSGVTASVLSTGTSQHRLVLTATNTGSSGIELVDDTNGTLQTLGLVDNTKTLNLDASGGAQSYKVSSSTAAIAAMLGVTMPPPSTITVGGRTITVDLTVDSLATIAAKIMAAGGNATVASETVEGVTQYRLQTNDTVTASSTDGQRTLDILGFMKAGRSGIAQVLQSENTFTDASNATATTSTRLTDLSVNGNPLGIAAGDTFTLQGARGDGSVVNVSFTVGASDTLQTLVNKLNAGTGYGGGSRGATASITNGQLVLTDGTAGDSQLSLSMSVAQAGGGTVALGRVNASTVGRLREVVAGTDARLAVDGVVMRRATNTVSDAIAGVTLNLQQSEAGTVSTVTIARDQDAIVKSMTDLTGAYNDMLKFRTDQSKTDAPLFNNSTLRANMSTVTNAILSTVVGAASPFTSAAFGGLSLQKDGTLTLDSDKFKQALATNPSGLTSLFATSGTATNGAVSYFLSTDKSVPGTYAIDITAAATTPVVTGVGFSGTYADDATADTMAVTDSATGATASVQLANGDSIDTIVGKLNAAFAAAKMSITASKSGNDLVMTSGQYGTAAKITTAFTAGGADGSAQLGITAGVASGTDVAGTIGGLVATGSGQILTGVAGGATEGLSIRYNGTATGNQGDVTFVLGVSGMLYNAADVIARAGGSVATQQDALTSRINSLQSRADTVTQALERRRASLTAQFVEMERALSQIQQQGTALSGFISQLSNNSN